MHRYILEERFYTMPEFDFKKRMAEICQKKDISLYRWWKGTEISQSTFYSLANGRTKRPSWTVIQQICKAADMDIATFFSSGKTDNDIPSSRKADLIALANEPIAIYSNVIGYYKGIKNK